jgi:PIN domain nuclease of toxin-antitoxin system
VIVLDTHAFVWWVSQPSRIPARSRRAIESEIRRSGHVAVSSISMWEVAMLLSRGRLKLAVDSRSWLAAVQSLPFLAYVPVDNAIAVRSVALEAFPNRDPADRMIVATALALDATLVTADTRLRGSPRAVTLWD